MRQIKFRARYPAKKLMFFPSWILTACGENVDMMEEPDLGELHRTHDGVELMQFTGLHDKDGKEIYEGDILKCSTYNREFKSEVIWLEEHARFIFRDIETGNNFDFLFYVLCYEVIGNIYENPELLKGDD